MAKDTTTPVIVACCRTVIGRAHAEKGLYRNVRGDELAAAVVRAAVERSGASMAFDGVFLLGTATDAVRCSKVLRGEPHREHAAA